MASERAKRLGEIELPQDVSWLLGCRLAELRAHAQGFHAARAFRPLALTVGDSGFWMQGHRALAGQQLAGQSVVQCAVGEEHAAILSDGTMMTWGANEHGQLAIGNREAQWTAFHAVEGPLSGVRIVRIALGGEFSCALSNDGRVYSMGHGEFGCLGHGTETDEASPRLISALDEPIVDIAAGRMHIVCASFSGRVYTVSGSLPSSLPHSKRPWSDSGAMVPTENSGWGIPGLDRMDLSDRMSSRRDCWVADWESSMPSQWRPATITPPCLMPTAISGASPPLRV